MEIRCPLCSHNEYKILSNYKVRGMAVNKNVMDIETNSLLCRSCGHIFGNPYEYEE